MSPLEVAVAEVCAGRRDAFPLVVRLTKKVLFRVALRILGDCDDAEDVLQESFLRALSGLEKGKLTSASTVEGWLYRIVVNESLVALRSSRRRHARARAALPSRAPDANPDARLALEELNSWLADLPSDQRVAIVLKELEGLSTSEVAQGMGTSVGSVEQRLVRARSALRRRRDNE